MTELGTHAVGSGPRIRPNVGSEVPMVHAIGREIIRAALADREFIDRATQGFKEYRRLVEPWTVSLAVKVTGVPAAVIRELAQACARDEPFRASSSTEQEEGRASFELARKAVMAGIPILPPSPPPPPSPSTSPPKPTSPSSASSAATP